MKSWLPNILTPSRMARASGPIYAGFVRLAIGVLGATALFAVASTTDLARSRQSTLTVYSSLPPGYAQTGAIVKGARLALEERSHAAGGFRVRFLSLRDGTRRAGGWTPAHTLGSAQRAARDSSAIAYIGQYNSPASRISVPILNEVPLAQISPSNTAVGLTSAGPGTRPREPSMYYPTGRRHFIRIAANDRIQGGALAAAMKQRGCRRIAAIGDRDADGAPLGYWLRRSARRIGLRVILNRRTDTTGYRALTAAAARQRADCTAYTGVTTGDSTRLFSAFSRALPRVKLFASDWVDVADPGRARLFVTLTPLAPSAYPIAGRRFFQRYRRRYQERNPDPWAIYGYEAMRLVLDAVDAVGANRQAVIDWLFAVRDRRSVLGQYDIDRRGDTTRRVFGVYRVGKGSLRWVGMARAPRLSDVP